AKRRSGSTQAGHGATWASTHPEIVTVSSSGLATAVAAGTATVTATIENTSATATVTVTPAEARRRRAGAIAAGVVLVGVAGALVWLKPWAPSVTLAPSRLVRLVTESAQVQVPAPADPRPQIEAAIATYARALEAQDINAVKRVAPGLSAQSVQNLRAFFKEVRSLKVTLHVQHAEVTGQSAQVEVTGAYEYVQS